MAGETQTTYTRYGKKGLPGSRASSYGGPGSTGIVEGANIPFGRAVSQGAADRGRVLGAALGKKFRGISLKDSTLSAQSHTTADQYVAGDNIGVHDDGDIWVTVSGEVDPLDPVCFNGATGVLGATGIKIEGASWLTTATNDVAVVRLSQTTGNVATNVTV